MTIQEMQERKRELGYSYETIAVKSGLPVSTVQKVLGGMIKSPREKTIQALEKVLRTSQTASYTDMNRSQEDNIHEFEDLFRDGRMDSNTDPYYKDNSGTTHNEGRVREVESAYQTEKKQGKYTLEDYFALPEERRVELIDGSFYDMSSPNMIHQMIAGRIHLMLSMFIDGHSGTCVPFTAPADVQLDCDDRTILEPDVFVVCDRSKIHRDRIFGAPDFIVEVLSRSTGDKDRYLKLYKYQNAGVREYWIVDPFKEKVLVYQFQKDDAIAEYSFEEEVPVGIFEGKCRIDFSKIRDYIGFLNE